jgi:CHAT domain-containing protein/tetratricopeptide (TPR) repeat protein
MRQSRTGGWVKQLLLAGLVAWGGDLPVSPAAAPPPRLSQFNARLRTAEREGRFAQAVETAREIAALHEQARGKQHWLATDARHRVEWYRGLVGLSPEQQRETGRCFRLLAQANRLAGRHRQKEAAVLFRQALDASVRILGEEHLFTAFVCHQASRNLHALGQYAQAQVLCEKALAIDRKVLGEEHPYTADRLNNVALCLNGRGKYAEAQLLLERALATRRKVLGEEHPATAGSFNCVGLNLLAQGKAALAQPRFERALAIFRKVVGEEHPYTVEALNHVAISLDARGKHAAAQPLKERALASNWKMLGKEHPNTAASLNNLAWNLNAQGKYLEAQPLYEKALAIRKRVLGEDHLDTAGSYNNLAANLHAQGKYAQAQPLLERALAIYRKVLGEEHPYTAGPLGNVAVNLTYQGQYARAQPLLEKALAILVKKLGETHPHIARGCINVAAILERQGKFEEALPLYLRAIAIRKKELGEAHADTASAYNNVAHNLERQGHPALALPLYEKATSIWIKTLTEDHPRTWIGWTNVALSLDALGKKARAQSLFEKALANWKKRLGEEHPHTARGYKNLAHSLFDQEKYLQALPLIARAVAISKKVLGENHPDTASRCILLAFTLWRLAQFSQAIHLLQAALPRHEAARLQTASSGFDRAVALSKSDSPHALLALGLARLGQPRKAFAIAEAGLARGLLDDLAAPVSAEARQAASLCSFLDRLDSQLLPLFGLDRLTADQKALREQLSLQRRAVLDRLARLAAHASASQVLGLTDIQKHLAPDAALVLWVDVDTLGEHQACIVRRNGPPVWVRLAGNGKDGTWTSTDLDLPGRLYRLLAGPPSARVTDQQRQEVERRCLTAALRRQRLEPLAAHLGESNGLPAVKHLFVVPTGWAAYVPLEVLGLKQRVSYVPSGSILAHLVQQRRPVAATSLLALGDPVFSPPAPSRPGATVLRGADPVALPGTRHEVQALARLVPDATVLLGSHASRQRLDALAQARELQRFRLIHLATHGIVDANTPGRSRLLLARDPLSDPLTQAHGGDRARTGELTVAAIRGTWKLDADLVVLSACRTALGRQGGGDGLLGFAQAFLQVGARSVVLSRWEVDDTATALLMVRFYENLLGKRAGLKTGIPRAAALEEARAWLRILPRPQAAKLSATLQAGKLAGTTRADVIPLEPPDKGSVKLPAGERPYAHPFYWAAFVLIGDPD